MVKHGWVKWFVAYMALAGGNYMVYSLILPIRIFHHVVVTLILLFWFLKYGIPRTHLLWPLLAVWASVLISAAAAEDKRMALEFAWHWISNGLFLLMLLDWFRAGQEGEILTFQFAAGGLIAASCVVQSLLYGGRAGGMLFNINLAGGYMAALVLPAYAYTRTRQTTRATFLMWILLAPLGGAIVLNESRGALLSIAVAAIAFTILQRSQTPRLMPPLLIAAIIINVGFALSVMSQQPGHALGDLDRLDLWRVAGNLISTHPLGVGPGLFGQAYQTLGIDQYRFTGAHNLYLTIGSELGGLGLASGAALVLVMLYGLIGQKRTPQQDASLAALCGIAAHMMVDNFPSQGFTFLCSLFVAHLLYEWQPGFSFGRLRLLPVGLAVVGCVFMLSSDRAQIVYERSLATGSYISAWEAVELDPNNRLYRINLSRAAHEGDLSAVEALYPELAHSPNLMIYGMVNYGRIFQ